MNKACSTGSLPFRYCRGVLPDGLVFNIPESDEHPSGRAVEEHSPPTQKTLDVYLAIPEQHSGGKNFTVLSDEQSEESGSRASTRYVAETRMMLDETLGAEEKPVQVAKKNFALLLEGENLDGFTALRIAQVTRSQAGAYILNPLFVAPCLNIVSSEYLVMLVKRQIELLTAKSNSLSVPRRGKVRGLLDFTTTEVASYWLLHTVNSYMPELKHIWKVRRGHPEALFVAMLRLGGALSTFWPEADALDLPDYDHDNLGPCFTELDNKVRALLNAILPERCISIPLQPTDKLIWSGTVPDDQYFKDAQFFLSVSAHMGVDDLINKFPKFAKISPPAETQRLIRNALPGVTLRHEVAPPSGMPRSVENQYFRLNQTGNLWEGIKQSRTVCVFVPGEIVEHKMELLILLE